MSKHIPGRLYYHKTDGGAEYLCAQPVKGTTEGDLHFAAVRLDGTPELLGKYVAAEELLEALTAIRNDCLEVLAGRERLGMELIHSIANGKARAAVAKALGE
jgi:hypothetical protein